MIDPSIADLMHYLDRPRPALMREEAVSRPAVLRSHYHAENLRRSVEKFEAMIADWIKESERLGDILIGDCRSHPLEEGDVARLRALAAQLEAGIASDAKDFTREQKMHRRGVKIIGRLSSEDGRLAAMYTRRYLAALAARGRTRAELALSISSLLAELDPANGSGPVFHDSKALGDYLRAAIA